MEPMGIQIRPLIVMDGAAWKEVGCKPIDGVIANYWETVRRWGGDCEVLVHNSFDMRMLDLNRLGDLENSRAGSLQDGA